MASGPLEHVHPTGEQSGTLGAQTARAKPVARETLGHETDA